MQWHLRRLAVAAFRPALLRRNLQILSRPAIRPPLSYALNQNRLISIRSLGTAVLLPKTYFFRVFWTLITGTIGFISYQISEASSWVKEKGNMVAVSLMSVGLGVMDWGDMVRELLAGMPNLMALLPPPKQRPDGKEAVVPLITNRAEGNDDDAPTEEPAIENSPDHFRHFIRRMIEIRDILKSANLEQKFDLPSIVVIGSQSSGKSSVLESIVGHEFLPKGQNMVTRRPLELTLVHSPDAKKDYGLFKADGRPIYDFSQIQSKLTELNLAVPETEWVSSEPIELTIYSKNVPDLTLVDLPGYIQISNKKQPPVLREKIAELCEKYIQGTNNLVLAVCPADVDLANAEALKAAQRVDPLGERTVGVITKLDLVDPRYAADLLKNEDYPLKLGYIGVVCKPVDIASRMLGRDPRADYERRYFSENAQIYQRLPSQIGIQSLRQVLTRTLENNMAGSLDHILYSVQEELSEVRYQLKVEFNDRIITPESYVASLQAHLKSGFEALMHDFTRASVRSQVDKLLTQQFLMVVEQYLAEPAKTHDESILEERLKMSIAALTKSGIGKKTIESLVDAITKDLESRLSEGPLANHPTIRSNLIEELSGQLRKRSRVSADMVENALKPYKDEVEFSPSEWSDARVKALELIDTQIKSVIGRIETIQKEVGSKRLRKVIQYLATNQNKENPTDELALSERSLDLLVKGKEVAQLNHRVKVLQRRYEGLQANRYCQAPTTGTMASWLTSFFSTQSGHSTLVTSPCLKHCPEPYLYLIHTRLLQISSLFIHHELIHEFLQPLLLHQESSSSSAVASLALGAHDRQTAMAFVGENRIVERHVGLIERRLALERVRDKLVYLKQRKEDLEQSN